MRTIVYVDGFNLYYAIVGWAGCKWLDLYALSRQVLAANNHVIAVKYFTARVQATPSDPQKPTRQDAYIRALQACTPPVEVFEGEFTTHVVQMKIAEPVWGNLPIHVRRPSRPPEAATVAARGALGPWGNGHGPRIDVLKTEEKGSDVNLAVEMLNDAWAGACDCAVIVSNDTDLAHAIALVRARGIVVGVITSKDRPSPKLRNAATFYRRIRPQHLRAAQLPRRIPGTAITKPTAW